MVSAVTAHTPTLHSIQCHLLLEGQYGLLSRSADWLLSHSITVRFSSLAAFLMRLPSQQDTRATSTYTPPPLNLPIPSLLHLQNLYRAETHFDGAAPNATG